ncbi:glycosyltransferase family 2 protein [Mobilicoccus pelagius]|uniref:Glycosyltransferase n=1 Tax=Mobilicoccus pelagius NBRC 104925 TaxID=1089455 RepID=H5UMV7_9MICO|nr:glycosyltransferase family 2 protein [Mobilicoccus pelagius]GAB47065.1 glycosyltransferase [Mobilicoccus pelagius NBRC 104925]
MTTDETPRPSSRPVVDGAVSPRTALVEHRAPLVASAGGEGPLVSILSPVRDEHAHLRSMLDSVLAQDHAHFELLLVDDGSTDDTADIVAEYAARDSRVRLVASGTAMGKVAAFDTAYAASSGEVVCHVGGDDTVPANALTSRVEALRPYLDRPAVAFFKLELFEETPGNSPTVVPRGRRGSMSGPSITMTRPLAERVMPIPGHLVSEDIWMGNAADALAEVRVDSGDVVVHYRRHAGNSNPRNKPFTAMDEALHARFAALDALLATDRFDLPDDVRRRLAAEVEAERLRHEGRTGAVLTSDLPLVDRLAVASMSHPVLWRARARFLTPLTGWRGR